MARFREAICYTRNGVERCTHHSAISSWLESSGWTRVGEEKPEADKPEPLPEILVEVGVDAYDDDSIKSNDEVEAVDLDELTKAELLDWALELGHDLKNALPKAEILAACKEIEAGL